YTFTVNGVAADIATVVAASANDIITVTDITTAGVKGDGTDTIRHIERLQFLRHGFHVVDVDVGGRWHRRRANGRRQRHGHEVGAQTEIPFDLQAADTDGARPGETAADGIAGPIGPHAFGIRIGVGAVEPHRREATVQ